MDREQAFVRALIGRDRPSTLMSDAYKFAMSQAGAPLRPEKFYLVLRKGGPWYIPFDMEKIVRLLVPEPANSKEQAFLTANGYGMNPAEEVALTKPLEIHAIKQGTWVLGGEPVFTVKGPQFLASWLEPLSIMLHYPIQVATAMMNGVQTFDVTCEDEATIIRLVAEALGRTVEIRVDQNAYETDVGSRVREILQALESQGERAFEVGMRAATCIQQHRIALKVCRKYGINKTSNVFLAWELYMIPVGTTGHEHQQRWGSDLDGFRAIRDMRPEPPSYLFDTYDPIRSGIPAAIQVMREDLSRPCSVRFDSGDQDDQLRRFLAAEKEFGIRPNYIFEDGYTAERTVRNELLCENLGLAASRRFYGYGGFIVSGPSRSPYSRDVASAVYKLTMSGCNPRMKFSGTPGKGSVPGCPVIFRPDPWTWNGMEREEGMIGQFGETPPEGYVLLTDKGYDYRAQQAWAAAFSQNAPCRVIHSPATKALIEKLTAEREQQILGIMQNAA
jgi:nicotinic acid phosphoribosyltransferase